jgi:hypothetical protein
VRRVSIVVGVLGAVLLAAVGAVPAIGSGHATPGIQKLFVQAVARVRAAGHGTFAKAVVYEADGSTRRGAVVKTAAGVATWQFVLDNPTPGSPDPSVVVNFGPAPKGFGPVVGHSSPFLEDVAITKPPAISLVRAITLLNTAGYTAGFSSVTLRNPLGPTTTNPSYYFGTPDGGVAVDAVTGKVTRVG